MPSARPPELRSYRVAVYIAYGLFCALLFAQLIRSIATDLYGPSPRREPMESPTACLEELDRLYAELSARAVQPAPGGLESNGVAREWDRWSRRWEDDVASVNRRCRLDGATEPARMHLASALEGLEELRRELSRSGAASAAEARQVKESLAAARTLLKLK